MNRCDTCKNYHHDTSTCRANAPRPRMVPHLSSQADESTAWPMVAGDEFCGEWTAALKVETK